MTVEWYIHWRKADEGWVTMSFFAESNSEEMMNAKNTPADQTMRISKASKAPISKRLPDRPWFKPSAPLNAKRPTTARIKETRGELVEQ